MERMLELSVTDNREATTATLPQHTENAVRLLHMVQDFLQAEGLVNPSVDREGSGGDGDSDGRADGVVRLRHAVAPAVSGGTTAAARVHGAGGPTGERS